MISMIYKTYTKQIKMGLVYVFVIALFVEESYLRVRNLLGLEGVEKMI